MDGLEVDFDVGVDGDAVVSGAACDVGGVSTGNHCLCGDAAGVDAGAAEEMAFDEGYRLACGGEADGEGGAGLACSDDDGVE